MMGKEEVMLSLKDFDPNSTQMVNKARRRGQVMEKNIKVSQLILAAKKLKVERLDGDFIPAIEKLRAMKKNDALPLEAFTKTFDARLDVLSKKVKNLTELKEAQNGFLKDGQTVALKDFSLEIDRLNIEREQFLIKYEAKLKREEETDKESAKAEKLADKENAIDDKTMEGADIVAPEIKTIKEDKNDDKAELLAKAKELGIDAKGTWGVAKLAKAIEEAK